MFATIPRRLSGAVSVLTNTFVGGRTTLEDFEVKRGAAILLARGGDSPFAGVLEVAREKGWEALPVVDMRARSTASSKSGCGRRDCGRDRDLVFACEGETFINPTNLRKRSFARLLQRAGLPEITFHAPRHTCATLLFGGNVHPKHVQELLGHANIAITLDIYSHAVPGMGDHTVRAMEEALR